VCRNAVRIRKENQVFSAEEKRALALITLEEKAQRENRVLEDFRRLLQDRKDRLAAARPAAAEGK
jgi:hypothetical protein